MEDNRSVEGFPPPVLAEDVGTEKPAPQQTDMMPAVPNVGLATGIPEPVAGTPQVAAATTQLGSHEAVSSGVNVGSIAAIAAMALGLVGLAIVAVFVLQQSDVEPEAAPAISTATTTPVTLASSTTVPDEQLRQQIEALLGSEIAVNVSGGSAVLAGEVEDQLAKTQAEVLAASIEGVSEVDAEGISVVPPPTIPEGIEPAIQILSAERQGNGLAFSIEYSCSGKWAAVALTRRNGSEFRQATVAPCGENIQTQISFEDLSVDGGILGLNRPRYVLHLVGQDGESRSPSAEASNFN